MKKRKQMRAPKVSEIRDFAGFSVGGTLGGAHPGKLFAAMSSKKVIKHKTLPW